METGTVIDVSAKAVVIATRRGVISVDRERDSTAYSVNDRVRIQNGMVLGRARGVTRIVRV